MSAIASDLEKLRELDAGMRQAWETYSDRLRGLSGEEYDHAELECWTELQRELRRLERRRRLISRQPS